MKLQWLCHLALACAWCLHTQSGRAQERWDPCKRPVATVATGTTKLTLKGDQSVFHEGEAITLDRTITYKLVQYSPQTGRNNKHFVFCLTPEGHDLLQEDEESGLEARSGAVGPNPGPYDTFEPGIPYVDEIVINESKSLPPGSYSVWMRFSNEVKFQVVPASPEWQAEQLASAVAVLDRDYTKDTPSAKERTTQALRVLRFLGSEASTRELARRFWFYDRQRPMHPMIANYPISWMHYVYERDEDYWDIKAGLMASPYREIAIRELTAAIHDHQHPATRAMVETLALLEIQSDPKYPRFFPKNYDPEELRSSATCPFLFMPCASHPSQLELQRQAKGAAYNDLLVHLLKQASVN
jgi:hypothetical protein